MKKSYILALVLMSASGAFAQSLLTVGGRATVSDFKPLVPSVAQTASAGDTLGLAEFQLATPGIYPQAGGYATGMMHSVDTFTIPQLPVPVVATTQYHAFAEGYIVNDDYTVTGAMFFAGVVESMSGTNPNIIVRMNRIEENKAISDPATVQSPDIPGPGEVMASATVQLESVAAPVGEELVATFVEFAAPRNISEDFCISVNIAGVYAGSPKDTIAFVSTLDGQGDELFTYHFINQTIVTTTGIPAGSGSLWAPTNAILQTSPGTGINVNFAIFAIVENGLSGIEEQGFINGVKLSAYPNPALTSDNVRIDYAVQANAKAVELRVFEMSGKLVFSIEQGSRSAGIHTVQVPTGLLSAGSYIYAITADNKRVAKRMDIAK